MALALPVGVASAATGTLTVKVWDTLNKLVVPNTASVTATVYQHNVTTAVYSGTVTNGVYSFDLEKGYYDISIDEVLNGQHLYQTLNNQAVTAGKTKEAKVNLGGIKVKVKGSDGRALTTAKVAVTNETVSGAVYYNPTSGGETVNSSGEYSLSPLTSGIYDVYVTNSGVTQLQRAYITNGTVANVNFSFGGVTVYAKSSDKKTNYPNASVTASVYSPGYNTTGSVGDITNLPTGSYDVSVTDTVYNVKETKSKSDRSHVVL